MSGGLTSGPCGIELGIFPTPSAHFGAGGLRKLGPVLAARRCAAAVLVTDAGMLATPVIEAVQGALEDAGLPYLVFSGVHAKPTTDDVGAGAEACGRPPA